MTLQKIGIYFLAIAIIVMGIFLNVASFLSVFSLERAIFYANLAILSGESITSFVRPIAALLSGGYLKIVDTSFIYLMIVVGWVLLWLGAQMIVFTKNGIPLRALISKKYWAVIDFEIFHKRKYSDRDLICIRKKTKQKPSRR